MAKSGRRVPTKPRAIQCEFFLADRGCIGRVLRAMRVAGTAPSLLRFSVVALLLSCWLEQPPLTDRVAPQRQLVRGCRGCSDFTIEQTSKRPVHLRTLSGCGAREEWEA